MILREPTPAILPTKLLHIINIFASDMKQTYIPPTIDIMYLHSTLNLLESLSMGLGDVDPWYEFDPVEIELE